MRTTADVSLLSPQQRLAWEQCEAGHGSIFAHSVDVHGRVEIERLRAAVAAVIARHDGPVSSFPAAGSGEPFGDSADLVTQVRLLPGLDTRTDRGDADRWATRPHGGSSEGRMRPVSITVQQTSSQSAVLHVSAPSLRADPFSLRLFTQAVARAYEGDALQPPSTDYATVAGRLNQLLTGDGPAEASGRSYWTNRTLEAAVVIPRRPNSGGPRIAAVQVRMPMCARLLACVEKRAADLGASRQTVMLAAWAALVYRLGDVRRVTIACRVDGRHTDELRQVRGPLARTVPFAVDFDAAMTFGDLVRDITRSWSATVAMQEFFSPADVAEPADGPIAAFEWQELESVTAGGATFTGGPIFTSRPGEIGLLGVLKGDALEMIWTDNSDSPDSAACWSLASRYYRLLERGVESPSERIDVLDILAPSERQQAINGFNETSVTLDPALVPEQIAQWAARRPSAPALTCGTEQLTYGDLNAQASRLASSLRLLGVGPESIVALYHDAPMTLIPQMLAVWKAGGAFVVVDPSMPIERLRRMLRQVRPTIVLTAPTLVGALLQADIARAMIVVPRVETEAEKRGSSAGDEPRTQPATLAYVVFTSGSSGEPKAIQVEHRNVANYVDAFNRQLRVASGLVFGMVTGLAADLAYTAVFPCLTSGGWLHVVPPATALDASAFAAWCDVVRPNIVKTVPSLARQWVRGSGMPGALAQCLVVGGEVLDWDLTDHLRQRGAERVVNHYGPAETTIGCLTYEMSPDHHRDAATAPVGCPLANVRAYVLSRGGEPVPSGIDGELYIGGAGVARGYANEPAETASRFVPDPFGPQPGSRLYRTGDRVRRLASGAIEFVCRVDEQIKIRGYRVEPREVECALVTHPNVHSAAVTRGAAGEQDIGLTAYIVAGESQPSANALRDHLNSLLPDYMVPSSFFAVPALPRTASGKIDRVALAGDCGATPLADTFTVSPADATQQAVAEIWRAVLRVEHIGPDDNFFDLGGHSLLLIQVHSRLHERFGIELPIVELFKHTTVAQLAQRLSPPQAMPSTVETSTVAAKRQDGIAALRAWRHTQ